VIVEILKPISDRPDLWVGVVASLPDPEALALIEKGEARPDPMFQIEDKDVKKAPEVK